MLKRFGDGHTNVAKEFVQNWFFKQLRSVARGSWLQQEETLQLPSIHVLATVRDGRERIPSLSSALIIIVVLVRDGHGGNERLCHVPQMACSEKCRVLSCIMCKSCSYSTMWATT